MLYFIAERILTTVPIIICIVYFHGAWNGNQGNLDEINAVLSSIIAIQKTVLKDFFFTLSNFNICQCIFQPALHV